MDAARNAGIRLNGYPSLLSGSSFHRCAVEGVHDKNWSCGHREPPKIESESNYSERRFNIHRLIMVRTADPMRCLASSCQQL